jgi:hypothetical protein
MRKFCVECWVRLSSFLGRLRGSFLPGGSLSGHQAANRKFSFDRIVAHVIIYKARACEEIKKLRKNDYHKPSYNLTVNHFSLSTEFGYAYV